MSPPGFSRRRGRTARIEFLTEVIEDVLRSVTATGQSVLAGAVALTALVIGGRPPGRRTTASRRVATVSDPNADACSDCASPLLKWRQAVPPCRGRVP